VSAIVSTPEELRALGPEWDRLASRFPTPLLSHDWFLSGAEALHRRDRPAVFVRTREGQVCAIAPLVERRRFGIRSLAFIGYDVLREPSGVLYDRPSDLRDLLGDVVGRRMPVYFDRVEDPVVVAELSSLEGGTAKELVHSLATSPWIRIDGPWKAYYETITSKWKSAHRRAIKKAGAEGAVTFEFVSPGAGEFDELMRLFVDVEGRSWKSRLGTALNSNPPLREFFERYGGRAAARGIARFAFMRVGGVPVSAQFGVDHGRRHWLLKIGYDENYSHCSPGILLMYAALERAFNEGLEAFEFLGSNESWIQVWNHKVHRYYSRSIDRVAARRAYVWTMGLAERGSRRIRRTLARSAKGG
jgi:CelD/BcsL family acetyltransferase involved in cellulose biosynthesis